MKVFNKLLILLSFSLFIVPIHSQKHVKLSLATPCKSTKLQDIRHSSENDLFSVSPNPNHGEFTIEFYEIPDKNVTEITIRNLQGIVIWEKNINLIDKFYTVCFNSPITATYVVTVRYGNKISHRKVIVY